MPKLAVTKEGGKRIPILARVTPETRAHLEEAAKWSGRSLSHEIESLLEEALHARELEHTLRQIVHSALDGLVTSAICKRVTSMSDEGVVDFLRACGRPSQEARHS